MAAKHKPKPIPAAPQQEATRELRSSEANAQVPGSAGGTGFAELGQDQPLPLWREFLQFIVEEKKWWMVPILLVCGLLGVLVILGSTGIAPMIYALW